MINIAVLGYGVVGSGVVEIIKKNSVSISKKAGQEICVKKILDIRDFSDSPERDLFTKNADEVFDDPSIGIVVETIGGIGAAYKFTKEALSRGKSVVTSNKELVATHGPELLKLAKENGVNYLFEASVGGGIPIIRPLNRCLAANEMYSIIGILNGTTNYILTQMKKQGKDFDEALKEAQMKGYAEADPTADIEGHDACRKIAILSSIAYNEFVDYKKIHTEGITKISLTDMKYAESMDSTIKLIAISEKIGDGIMARVSPAIVNNSNPLYSVEDVFNAIVVKGDAIGEAMFYGPGAGKLPTASAVVADVIEIVKHWGTCGSYDWVVKDGGNVIDLGDTRTRYFVRLKVEDESEARKAVENTFGNVEWIKACNVSVESEVAFVTADGLEKEHLNSLELLRENKAVKQVANTIRVLD
ncbi:homoserine dehydrogenase [Acetivibrio mesophilus]|uniref:Homoserine dehydrogenase n=1 Tax=Acetivibrio mesophilus TaxID=2487273 RepID=A0A4Q0I4C5_9FIRM|nr:homoserine dehydrogenase [Acetivibrio mesophilus]ODM26160.1 homoserine dehydrogenase [Clostridium sp. Bc-iso-3]RXE57762.1 homoserine dehydrogenase [Acetivibrio mesophilus]HHV29730.1 homoserine dehydrogenase [Clostridium sp.]